MLVAYGVKAVVRVRQTKYEQDAEASLRPAEQVWEEPLGMSR